MKNEANNKKQNKTNNNNWKFVTPKALSLREAREGT